MIESIQKYFLTGWGCSRKLGKRILNNLAPGDGELLHWQSLLSEEHRRNCLFEKDSVLIGWSLGGLFALELALTFPHRVKALILISSCARMTQTLNFKGVSPNVLHSMKSGIQQDKRGTLKYFSRLCFSPSSDKEEQRSFAEEALHIPSEDLIRGLDVLCSTDLRSELKKITMPVLLLHGDKDQVIPSEASLYLQENLKKSRRQSFQNQGHAMVLKNQAVLAGAIKDFLYDL